MDLYELINGTMLSARLQAYVFKWEKSLLMPGSLTVGPHVKHSSKSAESAEPSDGFQISWVSSVHSNAKCQGYVILPFDLLLPFKPPSPNLLLEAVWVILSWNGLLPAALTQEHAGADRNALGFRFSTWEHGREGKRTESLTWSLHSGDSV